MATVLAGLVALSILLFALALSKPPQTRPLWSRDQLVRIGQYLSDRWPDLIGTEALKRRLIWAGTPAGLQPAEFVGLRVLSCGAVAVAGFILGNGTMAILGALLGYVLPDMWLSNCVKRRQTLIERELAQFLDFWTSAVEAGLDLMPAVERIVVKLQGPLAHEFKLALQEVAVGYPRSVALEHLADRCGVPDLTQVIAVLVAAEQWGASVAEQLRACSQELWKQRTARARSRAGQISVAMQGPLLLLTLPGFLLMIMAPVAWHLQTLFN